MTHGYMCLSHPRTYRLLDLPLVDLDLVLQFVNELLETLLVLSVLVRLERQLLHAPVCLAHVLLRLRVAALLVVILRLQLANLGENKIIV